MPALSAAPRPALSAWSPTDHAAMREARSLARLGSGRTWTNPMVGAVVVANGDIVGTGYHHRAGEAHAEPLALADAGHRARGATLYVNLEPCLHHGRTPPCVEAIYAAGIARVVVSALDPDPRVSGHGVEWLRARGIRVDVGCDAGPAVLDNQGYYHDRLGLGPVVTLKMATSRDGMVTRARGQRDRVTGDESQLDVHRLRAAHDAIAIGIETARIDRPRLNCRLLAGGVDREPVIVLFDTHAASADDSSWPAPDRELVVMTGDNASLARVRALESRGARVIRCATKDGHVDVRDAFARLDAMKLPRVLVEGGPRLFASVVEADAWDVFWHYQSR
ncbi:MAG TPA: bifunctional diaminohydroxyphosphoribosylaminopyrimidine deaminase/5-amino-6-(5-phosphoribosylamino)uracil reductase RibD, partial [Candidatus Krumholzibacteria bacterium]